MSQKQIGKTGKTIESVFIGVWYLDFCTTSFWPACGNESKLYFILKEWNTDWTPTKMPVASLTNTL